MPDAYRFYSDLPLRLLCWRHARPAGRKTLPWLPAPSALDLCTLPLDPHPMLTPTAAWRGKFAKLWSARWAPAASNASLKAPAVPLKSQPHPTEQMAMRRRPKQRTFARSLDDKAGWLLITKGHRAAELLWQTRVRRPSLSELAPTHRPSLNALRIPDLRCSVSRLCT